MFNWDDLKFFLEVSKTLNLTKASESLNVDQTTVYRRILRFERKTGKKLLKKTNQGYSLTPWAEGLLKKSSQVGEEIKKIESYLGEEHTDVFGTVNITTTNVIANIVLPPILKKLGSEYPNLIPEITVHEEFFDIYKREADIAIRSSDTVEPHVHAEKIGKGGWSLYAVKDYMKNKPGINSPDFYTENHFIMGSERIGNTKSTVWLASKVENSNVVMKANSMPCIYSGVKSGIGIGMLPSLYGIYDSSLVELSKPDPKFGSTIWLIANQDLVKNQKIEICMEFLRSELKKVFSF